MSNSQDTSRDIDTVLVEAGATWRARQDFREVGVSIDSLGSRPRRMGSVGQIAGGFFGLVATGALALAILVAGPIAQRLGPGGDAAETLASSGNTTSTPVATAATNLSPAELAAAQLAVIEAVNADPANFAGVYIEKDGSLVIQYVGADAGRAKVEPTVISGLNVRWEKVDYSRTELSQIAQEIRTLNLKDVYSVSAGTSRNLVIVGVGPNGSLSEVSQLLAKYGDAVRIESSSEIPIVEPAATLIP